MDFKDELNIQSDKRNIESLIDDGIISGEEIANAPIILIEPTCKCNKGLEPVGKELRCPNCRAIGKESEEL